MRTVSSRPVSDPGLAVGDHDHVGPRGVAVPRGRLVEPRGVGRGVRGGGRGPDGAGVALAAGGVAASFGIDDRDGPAYAGAGSREPPSDVLAEMRRLSHDLGAAGWRLRTGGEDTADIVFSEGARCLENRRSGGRRTTATAARRPATWTRKPRRRRRSWLRRRIQLGTDSGFRTRRAGRPAGCVPRRRGTRDG